MNYIPSEEENNGLKYFMDNEIMGVFNSWLKENHTNHETSPNFDLAQKEYQFFIINKFYQSNQIELLSFIPDVLNNRFKTISSKYPFDITRHISDFWGSCVYRASLVLKERLFQKPKTFDELKVGETVKRKFREGEFKENIINVEYEIIEKQSNFMLVRIIECDDLDYFQIGQIEKLNKKQPKNTYFGGFPIDDLHNDQLDLDQQDPEFWDNI